MKFGEVKLGEVKLSDAGKKGLLGVGVETQVLLSESEVKSALAHAPSH